MATATMNLGVHFREPHEVSLHIGECTLIIPRERLVRLVLDDFHDRPSRAAITTPPKIGERWQGGIYAGAMRGIEGAPDYHLILAEWPEHESVTDTWEKAKEWAESLGVLSAREGNFHDYTLPGRREQRLLWANLPEHFQSAWYWSSEQRLDNADYACVQYFGNGTQDCYPKRFAGRACAVRRVDADR